jgi:TMEM175 potassium channel family protein
MMMSKRRTIGLEGSRPRFARMKTTRLEAFSDGVLAIIITIMVLELKVPHAVELAALKPVLPVLLSYVLSFIYIGIFWNNHHHLFQATEEVSGGILWANLHLLFWLSLFPFTTAWMGENHLAAIPTAIYGFVLLMAAIAYYVLQRTIIAKEGRESLLAQAVGRDWKGKLSPLLYLAAIPLAFVNRWIASTLYVFGALLWLIPDPRIEKEIEKREE